MRRPICWSRPWSRASTSSPATAATVTLATGQVQDGPYADSKEQLAGYIVIDVPDMDAALGWAARYPAEIGRKVEVRPNLPARP